MDREKLLEILPPFKNEALLIAGDQSVNDIITEVLQAHKQFAKDYDSICESFQEPTTRGTAKKLFNFLKKNIVYKVESDKQQTTRSPSAIIALASGDCKHYAGFIAGVLDALNRLGEKIDWVYRFASYKRSDSEPQHVFVVVKDRGQEIWIDPVLENFDEREPEPFYIIDKRPSMALHRLSGTSAGAIGITSITVTPTTDAALNLNFTGKELTPLKSMWPKYLGLDNYRDYSGDRNINETGVAAALNKMIAASGGKHTVAPDFVKWVYDNSIRSWNFYYPGGVQPNFDGATWIANYEKIMSQTGWPDFVITPDGRLTIDHDVKLDDYRNAGIHILTAWAQDLINQNDPTQYPLKPADLKLFSQSYTGNPGNVNADLFHEHRATSDVTKALIVVNDAVNIVKDELITVVGAIPRNAFLTLVRINMFSIATDLQRSIAAGKWDAIAKKWQDFGGSPSHLLSTINDAAATQPRTDTSGSVDVATVSGPELLAGIIAAAGPVLIAFMQFLSRNKDQQLAAGQTVNELNAANPGANYSLSPSGQLLQNGGSVSILGQGGVLSWIQNNPIMAVAIGVGIYLIFFND